MKFKHEGVFLTTESFMWGLASYIKPGTLHRYSHHYELHYLQSIVSISTSSISRIFEEASKYRKGQIGVRGISICYFIRDVSRLIAEWTRIKLQYIFPLITSYTVNLYSIILDHNDPLRIQRLIYSTNYGVDAVNLVEAIKLVGEGGEIEQLRDKGINESSIMRDGASLHEFFEALETRYKSYQYIYPSSLHNKISRIIYEENASGVQLNNAIVRGYLEYLLEHGEKIYQEKIEKAISSGGMNTINGRKSLYKIDLMMKKNGINHHEALPLIINSLFNSMIKGAMPP